MPQTMCFIVHKNLKIVFKLPTLRIGLDLAQQAATQTLSIITKIIKSSTAKFLRKIVRLLDKLNIFVAWALIIKIEWQNGRLKQ